MNDESGMHQGPRTGPRPHLNIPVGGLHEGARGWPIAHGRRLALTGEADLIRQHVERGRITRMQSARHLRVRLGAFFDAARHRQLVIECDHPRTARVCSR